MDRAEGRASPEPGSSSVLLSDGKRTPASVLVWAPASSRVSVNEVIVRCRARPRRVEEAGAIQALQADAGCSVAVVLLTCPPEGDEAGLEGIRRLQRNGFRILCCGANANAWSLAARCRPLLAGAGEVLDSSRAGFKSRLTRALARLLRLEQERVADEIHLKQTMRRLGLVGESPAMLAVFRAVLQIGPISDVPVLVTGETGTGKEFVARAIHALDDKRRRGPFIAINCSALTDSLVESELFGHKRGAFTGAGMDRHGLIRAAQGGVLFLDEVGEMNLPLQAKLLRVLQEHQVRAVGEDREIPVDVRIIAATNRDLSERVGLDEFRADLFHRLNVLAIRIPPLRERPTDVRPLIDHFLAKYRSLRNGKAVSAAPDFVEAVMRMRLPGNVRQVENLICQALVRHDSDAPIGLGDLPLSAWEELSMAGAAGRPSAARMDPQASGAGAADLMKYVGDHLSANGWNLGRVIDDIERRALEVAMAKSKWNQTEAGRLLGITPRTVYNKIRKYGLVQRPGGRLTALESPASGAVS